ncbi:MAG: phenylacetate--CoA ligase family protein, partial [Candidatus Omnitrophica bacterium]|nr:phenylacetate--CoA ligase family protein [Candidatus Omnitrophota bacterium]
MRLIKRFFQHYLRTGRLFKKLLNELERTERYTERELKAYQEEALRKIIRLAYENVPYYRNVFKERKLTPGDIKGIDDIRKLPIIDKNTVQENFSDFKNANFKGPIFKGLTSGTTGSPGVFMRDLYSINFENAALWRQYKWAGKKPRTKRITLRGELIFPSDRKAPPFWSYNPFGNELVMSSYHLSDKNIAYYIDAIKKVRPFDLYAYPSTAYQLASYCGKRGRQLGFSCVFVSSETLVDYQRKAIEDNFGCKVFDWYGSAERVSAICSCEEGMYHEVSDYSLTEYMPHGGCMYEAIGTTFHNYIMPLIRYST